MDESVCRADLVVVGAGVAGLSAALHAAEAGLRVIILNKGPRWAAERTEQPTSTFYAQGGVAVVVPGVVPEVGEQADSVDLHLADTLRAGAGLADEQASRPILADGWSAVSRLLGWGAEFDRDVTGALSRTREGGHSVRRIIHAGGDATGARIQRALGAAVTAATATLDIECRDDAFVTRVLTASDHASFDSTSFGSDSFDRTAANTAVVGVAYQHEGRDRVVLAPTVLLATGGAGHLYAATTNPAGATGDGLALALRAGARVADLEFVQFHPTMLFTAGIRGRRTLITEAIRGEGGRLLDVDGHSVTEGVHPAGDLAPRDVVANAVFAAMERTAHPCVYLDIRAVDDFERRFPTVTAGVRAAGIDMSAGLIPVVPGAHYMCGGVVTDAEARTEIAGLLAAGEVARTGLHGANRLASNSLLEGLVMGIRAAQVAESRRSTPIPDAADPGVHPLFLPVLDRAVVQDAMTRYVGLRRDGSGLREIADLLAAAPVRQITDVHDAEDANVTAAAAAVVAAAIARTESRGSHIRTDHPHTDPTGVSTSFALVGAQLAQVGAHGFAATLG